MPTYVDDDISGVGSIDFSSEGSNVVFISFDATTIPPQSVHPADGIADHWLKIGWFALGDAFDLGDGSFARWRDTVWWNWERNLWTPDPSTDGSGSATRIVATRIRWFIYTGGTGHLHVFGL